MKKLLLISILNLLFAGQIKAQTPQIVVVRPNGVSSVFSTWDLAYAAALDGDNVYLPGGTFTVSDPINKRLNIFGAGSNIDSSSVTQITKFNPIIILAGGSGGSIEGIQFNGGNCSIAFGDPQSTTNIDGFTISNCNLPNGLKFINNSINILIKNNIIGGHSCPNGGPCTSIGTTLNSSIISNNIISGSITNQNSNLEINNNIFTYAQVFYYLGLASNSNYRNNIFQGYGMHSSDSYFQNNANVYLSNSPNTIEVGTFYQAWDLIFEQTGAASQYGYFYGPFDFHIKNTSLCHNAGTDASDLGIYGGVFPWNDGQIPSNPHIFFKQIAPQTNTDGKLNVRIKVRTNN